MTTGMAAASKSGEGMFPTCIVASVSDVALSIARFVAMEVVELPLAALGQRSVIAVMRIVAVVDVAVKAGVAMEPWACSDEDAAGKPIGAVVAVGGAIIGGVVEVAVGADGRYSDVDSDLGMAKG